MRSGARKRRREREVKRAQGRDTEGGDEKTSAWRKIIAVFKQ